jgi:hypothetical protein
LQQAVHFPNTGYDRSANGVANSPYPAAGFRILLPDGN